MEKTQIYLRCLSRYFSHLKIRQSNYSRLTQKETSDVDVSLGDVLRPKLPHCGHKASGHSPQHTV